MLVTEGTATLITGGTLVDPHTESDGELRGTSIKDGQSQPSQLAMLFMFLRARPISCCSRRELLQRHVVKVKE